MTSSDSVARHLSNEHPQGARLLLQAFCSPLMVSLLEQSHNSVSYSVGGPRACIHCVLADAYLRFRSESEQAPTAYAGLELTSKASGSVMAPLTPSNSSTALLSSMASSVTAVSAPSAGRTSSLARAFSQSVNALN